MSASLSLARTPEPPYYAVIFTSVRPPADRGYAAMADRMMELALQQDGFLGVDSVRDASGIGITVSYWRDEASLQRWKRNSEHQGAQKGGQETWYSHYHVRVAKVERAYERART